MRQWGNLNLSSRLHHKVEVWKRGKSDKPNRLGQYEKTEIKVGTYWAGIIPQTGSLLNGRTAETTLTKTTHKIVMRPHKEVTADCWIVYKGQRYDILYIQNPFEKNEYLEIFTEVLTNV